MTPALLIYAPRSVKVPAATIDASLHPEYAPMPSPLPDRLSVDPASPYYDQELLKREVGIRFNGAEKTNVEEYSVSEGWIRVAAGKARDRKGRALTIKLKGTVEPFFKDEAKGE